MADYTPGGGTAPADSGGDSSLGASTFHPYPTVQVPGPLFGLRYAAGTRNPPMPRAARGDSDFAGVQWGGVSGGVGSNADLLQALYRMPTDQLGNYQTMLQLAGYGPSSWANRSGFMDEDTIGAYNNLLQDVAAYQANNPEAGWTPDSYLAARAAAFGADGSGRGRGRGGRGGAHSLGNAYTTTSSQVNLADSLQAQAAAHDTFTSQLGRNPNKKETAAFTAALHAYERAHPATSTTHVDASGNSSTTSHGGADEGAFAQTYTSSTQPLANEQGTMNEVGFVNVLQKLIGG